MVSAAEGEGREAAVGLAELAREVAALRARVDRAEGVLAIHALKARYAELVDRRYGKGSVVEPGELARVADAAAELFTEDAVWDGGPALGRVVGRAAIAGRLRDTTLVFARHLFLAPHIEVEGEQASGRWQLLSPCTGTDGRHYWMCGFEEDEYQRVDGVWLHRAMRLTTVFMAPYEEGWTRILR